MSKNEKTAETIGSIASRGLRKPESLTHDEIRKLAGSALTQRPDDPAEAHPKPRRKPAKKTK